MEKTKRKWRKWLLLLLAPVAYALIIRQVFDLDPLQDFTQVMSISFFFGVPFGIGYLTIYLSPIEAVKRTVYCGLMPWASVILFLFATILLGVEGMACWIMALPLFLGFASIGGLVAGSRRRRRHDQSDKLRVSIVFFLPFLLVPLEKLVPDDLTTYEADTNITIQATPRTIWEHVVRVCTIRKEEDRGRLTRILGFPRPIRAELDYPGIGGRREAIFSGGLVFEEIVKQYQEERQMQFSIRAETSKIPAATMDKHIIIGGDYFDVLDGTYELIPLENGRCNLHLYSHFTLKTRFNFYANWWAGWIMKDIQNNILQVIQRRCEGR